MKKKIFRNLLIIFALILAVSTGYAAQNDLGSAIESAIAFNAPNFDSLSREIYYQVENEPAGTYEIILPFFETPGLSERGMTFLISLLGATQEPKAVDKVCTLAQENSSHNIVYACYATLTKLKTEPAIDCLDDLLDISNNPENRFIILNDLAELKYEPAISKSEEILKSDAKNDYWKPIFFYGKMGDLAIPYLLEHVDSDDVNVRYNAINLLGQWLITPRATTALEQQFWREDDIIMENLILSSLEQINPNNDSLIIFMKQVKDKAKNKESKEYAKEAIQLYRDKDKVKKQILEYKKLSPEEFQKLYKKLWDSYGHEGDYEQLMIVSGIEDEPVLKELKERILQRNSDEAFYDYKKINDIISMNRLVYH